jgi:hypothetical protein
MSATMLLSKCVYTDHPLALLDIDLVADDDLPVSVHHLSLWPVVTYEWEALRVHGARLHQKLVPPAVQCVEALRIVDIVDEHAAVSTAVEGDAERLETLLAGRVPELRISAASLLPVVSTTYLHRHQPVVY